MIVSELTWSSFVVNRRQSRWGAYVLPLPTHRRALVVADTRPRTIWPPTLEPLTAFVRPITIPPHTAPAASSVLVVLLQVSPLPPANCLRPLSASLLSRHCWPVG